MGTIKVLRKKVKKEKQIDKMNICKRIYVTSLVETRIIEGTKEEISTDFLTKKTLNSVLNQLKINNSNYKLTKITPTNENWSHFENLKNSLLKKQSKFDIPTSLDYMQIKIYKQ